MGKNDTEIKIPEPEEYFALDGNDRLYGGCPIFMGGSGNPLNMFGDWSNEDIKTIIIDAFVDSFSSHTKNGIDRCLVYGLINRKDDMFKKVIGFFNEINVKFDILNGKSPSRRNQYLGYEFPALWVWGLMIDGIKEEKFPTKSQFRILKPVVAKTYQKYPDVTSELLIQLDLINPTNGFFECIKEELEPDWNHKHEVENEDVQKIKDWLFNWVTKATAKDKMRVENWMTKQKKSHRQIMSEIRRVIGNPLKFNTRFSALVEHLVDGTKVDDFFARNDYGTNEELVRAYFDMIPDFTKAAKDEFITKFILPSIPKN